jgi:cation diffusion facilitator CzcD-associated flavoprotein CzcO
MRTSRSQVAIIGAGPYGLAAAAHLRAACIETQVFGKAMEFWENQMPEGMLLRSSWGASRISDPHGSLTLDTYQSEHNVKLEAPVPLDGFIKYGRWFQRQVVPDLDGRRVSRVETHSNASVQTAPGGFRLTLEDGESLEAKRVVVAGGIAPFAWRPPQFDKLPPSLASHSADHRDLGRFAGQQVVVVGGGQSAMESAVLLSENGADVELIMRTPKVRWLRRSNLLHHQPEPLRRLLYPPTDVGPPVLNLMVAAPDFFRRLPRALQTRWAYRAIRPAASGWLMPRSGKVRITTGHEVTSAAPAGERLRLTLSNGTERRVDHVLCATGYHVDISRYSFLAPELVQSLRRVNGYPMLRDGFESSVPGLHFLGAPSAWSFGPLMRFVSGTWYTGGELTRRITRETTV